MQYSSWINVAKACAIVAVVIQHVKGTLYGQPEIWYAMWWAVPLFLTVGGYNVMNSYENRGYVVLKKRMLGIGIPYVVATILYHIRFEHHFNLYEVLLRLVHFDISGPLYYVAVYLQLVLITPVCIAVMRWCEAKNIKRRYAAAWLIIYGWCLLATARSNIFDIVLGGGRLFAGAWLFYWFVGMFIRRYENKVKLWLYSASRLTILTILLIVWQVVFIGYGVNLELGQMFPGAGLVMTWANTAETFILFFWFKDVVTFWEERRGILAKIIAPVDYLERHTLYIFLYHMLFLSICRVLSPPPNILSVKILYTAFVLGVMLLAPIGLEWTLRRLWTKFMQFMSGIKVDTRTL